jgi:hypothetical protein
VTRALVCALLAAAAVAATADASAIDPCSHLSAPAIAKAMHGQASKPTGLALSTHPLGETETDDCSVTLSLQHGRKVQFDTIAFCFPTAARARATWVKLPAIYRWKHHQPLAGVGQAASVTSIATEYFVFVLSGRGIYATGVWTRPRGPYAPSATERARIAQAHRAGLRSSC